MPRLKKDKKTFTYIGQELIISHMKNTSSKKLYRSEKNRILFGVCGGLGEYFEIDPVIMRVIFVMLALFSGVGFIAYLILMIVVPLGK